MIYFGYPLDIHGWKTEPETEPDTKPETETENRGWETIFKPETAEPETRGYPTQTRSAAISTWAAAYVSRHPAVRSMSWLCYVWPRRQRYDAGSNDGMSRELVSPNVRSVRNHHEPEGICDAGANLNACVVSTSAVMPCPKHLQSVVTYWNTRLTWPYVQPTAAIGADARVGQTRTTRPGGPDPAWRAGRCP
jgi:hypothetical protein